MLLLGICADLLLVMNGCNVLKNFLVGYPIEWRKDFEQKNFEHLLKSHINRV